MENSKKFIQAYRQHPIELFSELLNQPKYKYLYLIVSVFGLCLGCNKIIDKIYLFNNHFDLGSILFSLIKTILITFIALYIYSWLIILINSLLQGYASQKEILAIIIYSLIPWIVGSIIILALKITFYKLTEFRNYYTIVYYVLFIISLIFYLWSVIYLIIGNAIVNSFSIIKSIISAALLPLISIVYQLIKVIKMIS